MNILKGFISLALTVLMVYLSVLGYQYHNAPIPGDQVIRLIDGSKIVEGIPSASTGVTVSTDAIAQIVKRSKKQVFVCVVIEKNSDESLKEMWIRYSTFDEGVTYLSEESYTDPFPDGFLATAVLWRNIVIIGAERSPSWIVYFIMSLVVMIGNGIFTITEYRNMRRRRQVAQDSPTLNT